jgi:hypothetical protein
MGKALPRFFAGHGMPCPYGTDLCAYEETKGERDAKVLRRA